MGTEKTEEMVEPEFAGLMFEDLDTGYDSDGYITAKRAGCLPLSISSVH